MVIDDHLLEEARLILGTSGIRDTVEAGLKEAIRRRRLEELRHSIGIIDLDVTFEKIDRVRNEG